MAQCNICGRECSGPYCETCQFYITNDQCWRCRMYLPRAELQQWRGQLYCPYCILEIKDEDKSREEEIGKRARADEVAPPEERPPGIGQKNIDYTCDNCKSDLDVAYVIADHKFCELCFQQHMERWKKENIKPPPYIKFRIKEERGLFSHLLELLKRKIQEEWEKRRKSKKTDKE